MGGSPEVAYESAPRVDRHRQNRTACEQWRTARGPHRCGPAHFTRTARLRFAVSPAPRTHAHEAETEQGE